MIVIPAVDIRRGRCVRLVQGRPEEETVFGEDPVAMAIHWRDGGAARLHVVDLDGAFAGTPVQLPVVAAIAAAVGIPVQLGGGLRTLRDVEAALGAGVERVILGTAACADPDLLESLLRIHGDRVAVGIDARDGMVAIRGWAETTDRPAVDLARDVATRGVRRIIMTDIATDGMLSGPNLEGLAAVCAAFPGSVIASGGVACAEDVRAISRLGPARVEGVIVGRALYAGQYELSETPEFLAPAGSGKG